MLAKGCWRRIGQNLDSRGRKGPALWASGVSESRHWGGGRSYDLPQGGVVALVILSGAEQTEERTLEIVNVGTKMTGGSKLFRRKFTQALTLISLLGTRDGLLPVSQASGCVPGG